MVNKNCDLQQDTKGRAACDSTRKPQVFQLYSISDEGEKVYLNVQMDRLGI